VGKEVIKGSGMGGSDSARSFQGFESYWAVPASSDTAVNGEWVKGRESIFSTVSGTNSEGFL
jgi:4-alpha-glucanotransferase